MKNGRNIALERERNYLRAVLVDGDLRNHPEIREIIELALDSSDSETVNQIAPWIRVQRIGRREEIEEKQQLFWEPKPKRLEGDIFLGWTFQNRHPTFLQKDSFGGSGHIQIGGTSGYGKSVLGDYLTVQLGSLGIPTLVIDQTGQVAEIVLRHLPAAFYCDFNSYQRNLFMGPKNKSQRKWLQVAGTHLKDVLDLEPMMWRTILRKSEEILREGQIVNIPRLIQRLNSRDMSERGLLNRLVSLEDSTGRMFDCEYGFDLEKIFKNPCVFDVHDVDENFQRLLIYDLLAFYMQSHRSLPKWKLRNVLIIHESAEFVRRAAKNRFFFKTVRECRNYGLGLVLLNQSPHSADTAILSNIKTRCLFSLSDENAVDSLKTQLDLNLQQRNALMNLPRGVMLVKRSDIPDPFLVRVPRLF